MITSPSALLWTAGFCLRSDPTRQRRDPREIGPALFGFSSISTSIDSHSTQIESKEVSYFVNRKAGLPFVLVPPQWWEQIQSIRLHRNKIFPLQLHPASSGTCLGAGRKCALRGRSRLCFLLPLLCHPVKGPTNINLHVQARCVPETVLLTKARIRYMPYTVLCISKSLRG